MITKIIQIADHTSPYLEICGAALRDGELVAFPTETVYGLGANGLDEKAVKEIFKVKGRPQDNPLILHISSRKELEPLVENISEEAEKIMDIFWPGPLTILFKKSKLVPDLITAGLDTVAIRMPENLIARNLIRYAEVPIAAPSANKSGRPSPTMALHVYDDLNGQVEYIIDGGKTGIGLESTVLDLTTSRPTILRPGGITFEQLQALLKNLTIDKGILSTDANIVPKSPGQKYKHYAPKGEMFLFVGDRDKVNETIKEEIEKYQKLGKRIGLMVKEEDVHLFKSAIVKSMGSSDEEVGQNLFGILREFDNMGVDVILSQVVDNSGIGFAVINRMMKASGGKIVQV